MDSPFCGIALLGLKGPTDPAVHPRLDLHPHGCTLSSHAAGSMRTSFRTMVHLRTCQTSSAPPYLLLLRTCTSVHWSAMVMDCPSVGADVHDTQSGSDIYILAFARTHVCFWALDCNGTCGIFQEHPAAHRCTRQRVLSSYFLPLFHALSFRK